MEYKKYLCDIRRYTNQAAEFEEKARKLANVANYLKENKSGSKDLDKWSLFETYFVNAKQRLDKCAKDDHLLLQSFREKMKVTSAPLVSRSANEVVTSRKNSLPSIDDHAPTELLASLSAESLVEFEANESLIVIESYPWLAQQLLDMPKSPARFSPNVPLHVSIRTRSRSVDRTKERKESKEANNIRSKSNNKKSTRKTSASRKKTAI